MPGIMVGDLVAAQTDESPGLVLAMCNTGPRQQSRHHKRGSVLLTEAQEA